LFILKKQKVKNKIYQSKLFFGIKPKIIPQDIAWAISLGRELLFNDFNIFVKNFIICNPYFF